MPSGMSLIEFPRSKQRKPKKIKNTPEIAMMISCARRSREYGDELAPEKALAPVSPNESPRGLPFLCLNANISRQFKFLQNAWITNTKFSGVTGESDPLPGCPVTGNFTIPGDGTPRWRVSGLPQFVTVRGGGYFFLPSLRALRYFAGA